jgi:deoxyribodipyrimidine photo-lyase
MPRVIIHWFRQDLRLHDNPALHSAAKRGRVLPVYILDDDSAGDYAMGGASRWWLYKSLTALNKSLDGKLCLYKGAADIIIPELVSRLGVEAVYWNRCYEPWRIEQDKKIKFSLSDRGVEVDTFNASLLWEPWQVRKKDETPYRVFTPFYRRGCLVRQAPREPLPRPEHLNLAEDKDNNHSSDSFDLLPRILWYKGLDARWHIGEEGAHERLENFLDAGIKNYKQGRNLPAKPFVSALSPHLHFGEVSPNQVWYATRGRGDDENIDHFCSELGWREFSHSLLFYNPDLPVKNLQQKFDAFPWRSDAEALSRWQQGQTGYPIVDAGMRELWQTGIMHNRVRMIVGSFLVKNLLLHWHHGERWFWDCLVDADLANNSAGWQWIAGCGADASPYFRIFNPITQGEKFDTQGEYTRLYVPELKHLPDKHLFSPWLAPKDVLEKADVRLGENYPEPIVDLKQSRERALTAYQSVRTVLST